MRALLIVNPAATTTSARTREVLASALETDLKLEVVHTRQRGHGAELARGARADGLDLVVALGGDGTVNEVVNGLLSDGPGPDVPALAVVPGGGTNVFSRALGLPRDPVEATGALLDAIREGRRRSIGLGRAGERWFTFNAGMGWDAEVVARVDRRRRREPGEPGERHSTPADYVRAALEEFFLHTDRRHPALSVQRPGADPVEGVHMAIVANTAPWTFWGERPLLPSPDASFDTGLDLYALTRLHTLGTLAEARALLSSRPTGPRRRGPFARRGDRSAGRTRVHRQRDLTELTLVASRPIAAQVDGEPLGQLSSLSFRAVPHALVVMV